MERVSKPQHRISAARVVIASSFCIGGALLVAFGFVHPPAGSTSSHGPMLANLRTQFTRPSASNSRRQRPIDQIRPRDPAAPTDVPTFGNPVISGIGGVGFEQSIRIDPNTINAQTTIHRIYTSAPGSASADTSWVWHSLDGGKTFKWVVGAAPLEGKVTTCHGGGDSEIAVDSASHLYFNDLTLANFSTARSDDFGATFTCSNTGVPDTVVDRQWYAIDGDPTNGGTIYLANDEVGQGGVVCGATPANNVLAMYRSPIDPLVGALAGITFGPPNRITGLNGCDEAIMGNNEISQMATPTGQPNGLGGFAQITPVKHVYVVHDNAALNQIRIARCFPVAFGVPVANVSDPSGLNCTDLLVKDLGVNAKTGANFPTMAIDKSGNLYAMWEEAPLTAGVISGDVVLKFSYSTNEGNTWSTPITINTSGSPVGTLHQNVFAWMAAGDDGRVDIAWYGTPGQSTSGAFGPDDCNDCSWSVWFTQSVNAHSANPTFTAPILASQHPIHKGSVQSLIGGQNMLSSRALGDYLQMRMGPRGEAHIAYVDSNNIIGSAAGHAMYVQQNGGTGLIVGYSPVNAPGLTPFNAVSDPAGDGKYEALGVSSANMPQLDILKSSVSKVTTAPCSVGAPCYKVFVQVNDLSLAPTTAQDSDPDLVWSTQWFVPSSTDSAGGKNFHVYAESLNGGALQCYYGENAVMLVGGGAVLTYPGTAALPAANCQSTLGPNGNITIYVPLSNVTEAGPIDNRLHEVTASTMTLTLPANTNPSVGGIGGTVFNLIDVAQGYIFDPTLLVSAVSRKVHGLAGTFDVDLTPGTASVECRSGGASNDYQVVVTFATPVIAVASATVSPAAGSSASVSGSPVISGNQVTVNLTDVSNAQTLTINLFGVNTGTLADFSIPMSVLVGDTNTDGSVNSADISQTKSQSGQVVGAGNFREDVNADGALNSADISLVKSKSGTALP